MAQETAVEFLFKQYKLTDIISNAQWDKARRMHEMQIKDAFIIGRTQGIKGMNNAHYSSLITAEDYYNQNYKTQA